MTEWNRWSCTNCNNVLKTGDIQAKFHKGPARNQYASGHRCPMCGESHNLRALCWFCNSRATYVTGVPEGTFKERITLFSCEKHRVNVLGK